MPNDLEFRRGLCLDTDELIGDAHASGSSYTG
jgi:hypothetical protein